MTWSNYLNSNKNCRSILCVTQLCNDMMYIQAVDMENKTKEGFQPGRGTKMLRTQIMLEPNQHQQLTAIARAENRSLSDLVRQLVDAELRAHKRRTLQAAVEKMANAYASDKELTAFTALDGEDFIA